MMGVYTGEVITKVILPVLKEYSVLNKLGVFITDNTESNNTVIKALLKEIKPEEIDILYY
jgi:hypothetical protein